MEASIQSSSDSPISPSSQESSRNMMVVGGIWMLALALMLLSSGLCSIVAYIVYPLLERSRANMLETNVVFGSAAGLGFLLGGVLLWYGIQVLRRRESIPAANGFPHPLVFIGLFIAAVLVGWFMLSFKSISVYAFPPWHFVASITIPLAWLAFAAQRLGVTSGLRALIVSISWGALGAITLAVILEIVIGLMMVLVVAVVVMLLPNSDALIRQWMAQLEVISRTNDVSSVSQLFNQPVVIGVVLLYVAVLVPLAEEAVKTLVVACIDPRRTRLADAVLWGIGAGAGFAIIENMFNGGSVLATWGVIIVMRIGAAMMHIGNGALMGRGWHAARVERRWGQLILAYLIAVFLHGVWNAAAVLTSTSMLTSDASASLQAMAWANLGAFALLFVLIVLTVLQFVWIVYVVRSAQSSLQTQV